MTEGVGATHVTEAQCARALPSRDLPYVTIEGKERWRRLERVGRLLEAHPYRFAKTMPDVPHCYTRRHQWAEATKAFSLAVDEIHLLGERRQWYGSWYDYLEVNDFFYWSMEPRYAPPEATSLINRAMTTDYYEPRAPWMKADEVVQVEKLLCAYAGSMIGLDVLDIGGVFPQVAGQAGKYVCIGPAGDVERAGTRVIKTKVTTSIQTSVQCFVPVDPERFDVVLCGVASHLQVEELARLPCFVKSGGHVVAVFYAEKSPRVGVGRWRGQIDGQVFEEGIYTVVVWPDEVEGIVRSAMKPHTVSSRRSQGMWPR